MMGIPELIEEAGGELPEGFVKVSVLLTANEAANLKKVAARTAEGTYSAAIRRALKWPEAPYGLKAALVRLIAKQRGHTNG